MDHIMFKPKLNTHLFRFNQLVEIEHWNSWQVFFWNAGETPSNQEPTLEVSSDVMLKVDQNGTSQKISPFWIRLCTKVMKIHSFQRRFRLVCSPPPVGIEGWWANVPTSFHQNESRLNRKITHLRPVRFNVLFLLVNLHCRQHDVFFSSQHAFYIQNTIILEGFMIYSFKLPSSLEMSHQAIHAFKHPYFRSFLSSFFSFLWIKVIQNTDPISTTAQSCFLFNKCCFSHRSGRKISSDIPTTESMYIIFYSRIHVWGFLNLDLIYSWAKRR